MGQAASGCHCGRKCGLTGAMKRYSGSKGEVMAALRLSGSQMSVETRQLVTAGGSDRRLCSCKAVVTKDMPSDDQMKTNQIIREGDFETPLVELQVRDGLYIVLLVSARKHCWVLTEERANGVYDCF